MTDSQAISENSANPKSAAPRAGRLSATPNAPQGLQRPSATKKAAGLLLTWPEMFKGELVAWRSPTKNTRLLIAYIPGMDPTDPRTLVNVLVKDNRNFLPGMKLKARFIERITYELVGPCPPRRGRWR